MTIPFGQGSLLCRFLDNILPEVIPEEESRSPVYLCGTQHGAAAVISSVELITKASTAGCSDVSLACGSVDSVGGRRGKYKWKNLGLSGSCLTEEINLL
jgi:hypothetical protein